jgi:uncharacterized protein
MKKAVPSHRNVSDGPAGTKKPSASRFARTQILQGKRLRQPWDHGQDARATCDGRQRRNQIVEPKFTILTLGVDDLERSLKFYRDGMGLATKGIVGKEFPHGAVVFFDLEGGMKLALYPRAALARDAMIPGAPPSPTESSIGHLTGSPEQVDAIMEQARRAGAKIVKVAQKAFWGGYHGYFQDPDGHLWEIAWNPGP